MVSNARKMVEQFDKLMVTGSRNEGSRGHRYEVLFKTTAFCYLTDAFKA